MKISDIFRQRNVVDTSGAHGGTAVTVQRDGKKSKLHEAREGEDRISISSLGRQFSKISEIQRDEDDKRAERVATLKKQIDDGTYAVKSEDVARAVLSFARDSEVV